MEEDYELIKKAVTEAMHDEMKDFYIDREKHYQHHEFIATLMEWKNGWKSTCMKAIANTVVTGILFLLIWGFIAWGGKGFK